MMLAAITVALVANLAPPARYDHEPRAAYHVSYMPQEKLQRICAGEVHTQGDMVLGCSMPDVGLIFMAKGLKADVADVILRHEKAHLNGWPHSHPGAGRKVASAK